MEERFCIVVDNEEQSATLKKVADKLHTQGIQLVYEWLNPLDDKFLVFDELEEVFHISTEKITHELRTERYLKRRVDLVICDYTFKNGEINGFDIILLFRELNYKRDAILYSGGLSKIIKDLFENDISEATRIKKIEKLVKAKTQFIERDTYDDIIQGILKKDTVFDFERELENWLYKFGEFKPLIASENFREKTFNKIADLLREENNQLGVEFKKEFLEMAFAIMIDLNNIE